MLAHQQHRARTASNSPSHGEGFHSQKRATLQSDFYVGIDYLCNL